MPTAYPIYAQPLMAKPIMGRLMDTNERPSDSPLPEPIKEFNFLRGTLPAGLTYTNSSTTRTYFGSDGLLKTAAANEPIFEYDPLTLTLRGMRWEMEQRTNLLVQSIFPGSGVAPTSWSGGTIGTSGPAASVYGNADGAQAWTQTATANRPYLSQNTSSLSANTTYIASVLIESVSGAVSADNSIAALALPAGATTSYPACSANPSGGGSSSIGVGILEVRIAISATAGAVAFRVGLGVSGNATGTLQFSRPQLEAGVSRSSYIPTAAAAVTRQPDVLTATSISPWYRQDEGTVVFEGILPDLSIDRGNFVFLDGTNNNRQFSSVRLTGISRWFGSSAGATQCDINTGSITAGSVFRHVGAYRLNDFASAANGSAVAADTSGALPVGINALRFGVAAASGANFMGYARRFDYYNTRLPHATIQGLSRV